MSQNTNKAPKRRRLASVTRVACNTCRARKIAVSDKYRPKAPIELRRKTDLFECDGTRPCCSSCFRRGYQCDYDTGTSDESRAAALKNENKKLRAKVAAYEDFLGKLKNATSEQLLSIVQQGDQGEGSTALSRFLPNELSPGSRTLSMHKAFRATLPPTQSRME